MNKLKQVDVVRKRNAELTKQLDDMRFKLEFDSQLNMQGYQRAKDLINDLEKIKHNWINALDDLNDKRAKYDCLINELQEMKKAMVSIGFKIPWYRKIINKLKSF